MTIRRGGEWGSVAPVPGGIVLCRGNLDLNDALNSPNPPTTIGVLSGDLQRTVSSSPDPSHYTVGTQVVTVTIDLIALRSQCGSPRAASHVVARRSWWSGEILVVSNAQFLGSWDVAPRSHPNDGLLDISHVRAGMPLRQRIAARPRLRTASHLPHPDIEIQRVRAARWEFRRPLDIYVDGKAIGRSAWLEVECLADALTVCI